MAAWESCSTCSRKMTQCNTFSASKEWWLWCAKGPAVVQSESDDCYTAQQAAHTMQPSAFLACASPCSTAAFKLAELQRYHT
jgi:hypothetical protein